MSGSSAIKGFLLQTLICILETLENKDWKSVTIEPQEDSEKVDITWFYAQQKKVVQVKHSINQIGKSQVEKWSEELELNSLPDVYMLLLLGPCSESVTKIGKIRNVQIPAPLNNNETALLEQASFKLDKFLEKENILNVTASLKELIVKGITTDFLLNSIKSTNLSHEQFHQLLLNYICKILQSNNHELRAIDKANYKVFVQFGSNQNRLRIFPEFNKEIFYHVNNIPEKYENAIQRINQFKSLASPFLKVIENIERIKFERYNKNRKNLSQSKISIKLTNVGKKSLEKYKFKLKVNGKFKALSNQEDANGFSLIVDSNFQVKIEGNIIHFRNGILSELIENDSISFIFFIVPEPDYYEIPLEWEFISKGDYKDSGELVLDIFPNFIERFTEINIKDQFPEHKISEYWSEKDEESQDEI